MKAPVRLGALAIVALLMVAAPARAALFEDDEARKAILDLRTRVTSMDEQTRKQMADLVAANAALAEQVQQLRRSLVELNTQLEGLRGELARQRGSEEQLARDVAELQRRQKDLAQGVDERVRKLEPQKVSVDGKEFLADADEKRQYDEAIAVLRTGDFDKAVAALGGFVKRFPASGFAESARFWLGNALYGKRDYKDAIATFRAFVAASPDHARAPEALLALANSQAEAKDVRGARRTIDDLLKQYPKSEAAQAGRERLATLK